MVLLPMMRTRVSHGLITTSWAILSVYSSHTTASRNMYMQRMEGIKNLTPTFYE